MESSLVKMNMLERVQRIRRAGVALGIRFCNKSEYTLSLPDGCKQFGISEQFLFCFAEGYQETVFVWDSKTGIIKPVAYDFSEFLRLIFSCGSGNKLARMAMHYQNEYGERLKGLEKLQNILNLMPIPDPESYMRTVGQVIDCSRLSCNFKKAETSNELVSMVPKELDIEQDSTVTDPDIILNL